MHTMSAPQETVGAGDAAYCKAAEGGKMSAGGIISTIAVCFPSDVT